MARNNIVQAPPLPTAIDDWQRAIKAERTLNDLVLQRSNTERALFASLAPSSQTSAILKSACRTWEDYLWAQVSIMCEEKQSAEMLRLDGWFWEGGMAAVERGVAILSREEAEQEELEWEKEVESTLKSLSTVQAPEGYVL